MTKNKNQYDLIIIGAGPAGITAGIYAARQKMNTLLITKGYGGQVARKATTINNFPGFKEISGQELIKKFKEHLDANEVKVVIEEVSNIKKENNNFVVFTKNKKNFFSKAVIIASGADPRPLEVPGEKEFLGKGVSYCAICDGPIFEDKNVAVIGGGNAGFESAIFLSNYVQKIYILEYMPEVGAFKSLQEVVEKSKKTEIITNAELKEIKGDNFVESIIYKNRLNNKEYELKVEGVFIEVGNQPATSFAKGLVDFNERDEIKVDFETYQTKTPGLFAVGDANVGEFKQIITACGEGAKAALAAYRYILKK